MRIKPDEGRYPITLIGIWSISALNALPGLAVSPILGKLSAIFPTRRSWIYKCYHLCLRC